MHRRRKQLIFIIFSTLFLIVGISQIFKPIPNITSVDKPSKSSKLLYASANVPNAIVTNLSDGKELYTKNANKPVAIASLIKLLSIYAVFDQERQGHLKFTDKVFMSAYGEALTNMTEIANAPMKFSEKYTYEQLINMMLIGSANNASVTLAEGVSGSEKNFINLLKTYLKKWKITDYKLNNVTGLDPDNIPNEFNDRSETNFFSARAIGVIAQNLVNEFPEILKTSTQLDYTLHGQTVSNTNKQVFESNDTTDWKITGLKTGTSSSAGHNLISTATLKDNRQYLVVVLGGKTNSDRYTVTNSLLRSAL